MSSYLTNKKFGVYFIANDRVLELTLAFLNSFRKFNPDIPLCLIPYDSSCKKVLALSSKYQFEVFQDPDLFAACDKISALYHSEKIYGHYRKFMTWEGPFENFIYIDIDTVVLHTFDHVFQYLKQSDYLAASGNEASTQHWVWKNSTSSIPLVSGTSIKLEDYLTLEEKSFAANTGFFCSKKGLLSLHQCSDLANEALPLKPHMELHCIEQPLLNYVVVKTLKNYTSFLKMALEADDSSIPIERWAGFNDYTVKDGSITVSEESTLTLKKNPTLFLHWAGLWQPTSFIQRLISFPRIPYKKLWKHYRYLT